MDIIKRRSDMLERQVGDEHMLYDAAGRKVHVLNETAYFVWGLCEGACNVDEMTRRAAEAFDASPDALRTDIEACLAEFKALSILE